MLICPVCRKQSETLLGLLRRARRNQVNITYECRACRSVLKASPPWFAALPFVVILIVGAWAHSSAGEEWGLLTPLGFGVFLGALLALGVMLYCYKYSRISIVERTPDEQQPSAQETSHSQRRRRRQANIKEKIVIEKFQRRRRMMLPGTVIPIVTAFGLFLLAGLSDVGTQLRQIQILIICGGLLFIVGMIFTALFYRCPNCRTAPQGYNGGVLLNPTECARCGMPLSHEAMK